MQVGDGTVVQTTVAPTWLLPAQGGATSMPVDESVYSLASDSGQTFRYDTSGRHYQYNWKTAKGGSFWRIGVTLDDGETHYVSIALR